MDLIHVSTISYIRRYTSFFAPLMDNSSLLSLPFSIHETKFELAAVDVVEKACRLCVDRRTNPIEKNDQTLVTIADFGLGVLVSLVGGDSFYHTCETISKFNEFLDGIMFHSSILCAFMQRDLIDLVITNAQYWHVWLQCSD
ncbi:hypothetical protein P3X46_020417 [Hevea brasiliensis]|uniref:Protein kinase domain-containing protein n=1 Tax=Hevea brasiliensis TaxID=3981 RepID=A0ABQ9LNP0_HEVBR|nr:hypothetical protein P3X46_020417 [Hevea brasiliensis]